MEPVSVLVNLTQFLLAGVELLKMFRIMQSNNLCHDMVVQKCKAHVLHRDLQLPCSSLYIAITPQFSCAALNLMIPTHL